MNISTSELGIHLKVIKIYAPNQNRLDFWHSMLDHPLVTGSTIIEGDLNFSMGIEES